MARKPKVVEEPPFGSTFPFGLEDLTGTISYPIVALEESFHAVRVIYRSLPYNDVRDSTFERAFITLDKTKGRRDGFLYGPPHCSNPGPVTGTWLDNMRNHALEYGASPEAVRLIGLHLPWTKKEEAILAEKLKSKAEGAKKAAAGKAEKAPKPVAGGGKNADSKPRKGNPEALKKAREARAEAGPDVRKITIVNKENPYREGSNRAASYAALKGAKTVEDYKTAGGKTKYLSRWVDEGRIKLA